MKFKATLKLGIPFKPFTVKAPTFDKAKQAATHWAKAIVQAHKDVLGEVKTHQWGFWYDLTPKDAPDDACEAIQHIGDGELRLKYESED